MTVTYVCHGCGYPISGSGLCASCRSVAVISWDQSGATVQEPANQPDAFRML